jgi:hypothetical protein
LLLKTELPAGLATSAAATTAATATAESTTAATAPTAAGASTATAAVSATSAATTSAPLFAGASLVDAQGASIQLIAVECLNCVGGFRRVTHFDESKAARLTSVTIAYEAYFFDTTVCREGGFQILLRSRIRQVTHIDIGHRKSELLNLKRKRKKRLASFVEALNS